MMSLSVPSPRLLFSGLALFAFGSLAACSQAEQGPGGRKAAATDEEASGKPIYYHHPRWSPDGARIAFYSNRHGNFEIYTVRPDGSGLQRLTENEAGDTEQCWSPDGAQLLFAKVGSPMKSRWASIFWT